MTRQSEQDTSAEIPSCVAVLGAGTMGAGIAQLAAQAGARTLLYDPDAAALERGVAKIAADLDRIAARGKIEPELAAAAKARIEPVGELADLVGADFVIEAAPENAALKRRIFDSLAAVVRPDCVLATNTSSLSVSEIAAPTSHPERVVGMHFFNPAPVMRLVEVVAGAASSEAALATTRALGVAMGKRVIDAADVAGFLVNRVNRPYSLESLKLLEERVADVETIDRIERTVGGFRMGSFELMDLIGIETNHAVAEVFTEKSYGEPRYRPSPLAAAKVAAGTLGRKSGRGWYRYGDGAPHRPEDPTPPDPGGGEGMVLLIRGELVAAAELRGLAEAAGFTLAAAGSEEPWLTIDFGEPREPSGGPRLRHLHDGSLHRLDPRAAGFHLVPPLGSATAIELTSTPLTDPAAAARADRLVRALGRTPEPVGDAVGLVLGRVVCQLINEAAFLIGEGHGAAVDIDPGLELALNHPRGPIAWSHAIGCRHVVELLDALASELGEPRYRVAPALRRARALGVELDDAG